MPIGDSFGGLQAAQLSEVDAAYRHYLALVGAQEASRRTALAERESAIRIPLYFQERADLLNERAQERAERRADRASEIDYARTFNREQIDLQREGVEARKAERADILGERAKAGAENLFERLSERINRGEFDTLDALKAGGGDDPRINSNQFGNLRTLLGQRQLRMRQNFEADAAGVASDLTEAFKATPEYKAALGDPAQLANKFSEFYQKLKPTQTRYIRPVWQNQTFEPRRDIAELPSDALAYAPGYRSAPTEPDIAAPFRFAAMVQAAGRPPVVAAPATTAPAPALAPIPVSSQAPRSLRAITAPIPAIAEQIRAPVTDYFRRVDEVMGSDYFPRPQFGPPVAPTIPPRSASRDVSGQAAADVYHEFTGHYPDTDPNFDPDLYLSAQRQAELDKAGVTADRGVLPLPARPTSSAPVRITTRAEFEALPKGARFINPADGRVLVK